MVLVMESDRLEALVTNAESAHDLLRSPPDRHTASPGGELLVSGMTLVGTLVRVLVAVALGLRFMPDIVFHQPRRWVPRRIA